jgi:hypothetical protein
VSTLVTPNLWTLVGSVTLPTVPLGEILTVSGAITWPAAAVPAPGHYCFVALIGTADDPAPAPQAFLNWTNFQNFIKNNNNVTWRNFNVVDNVPPSQESRFIPLPFLMAGAPDRGRVFDIEVVGRLPEGARLMLELPAALAGRLRAHHLVVDGEVPGFGREPDPENKVIVVAPHGSTRFADVLLAAAAAFPCRLFADVPEDARKGSYRVYVRQLYKNEEVGRVTWLLAPPRDSDR